MGCGAGSAGKAYAADGAAAGAKAEVVVDKGHSEIKDIAKAQRERIAGGKADANVVQELMQGDAKPADGAAPAAPVSVQFRPAAAEGLRRKVQSCSQHLGGFQAMFNMADCDKSKKLDVEEFIKLTRMVVAHEQCRKDNPQMAQRDVLQAMSTAANAGTVAGCLSVRECTCLFWSLDEDESGKIEYDEFEAWVGAPAEAAPSVSAAPSAPANAAPAKAKSAAGGDAAQSANGKTDAAGNNSAPASEEHRKASAAAPQSSADVKPRGEKKPEQKPKPKEQPRTKESIQNKQKERIASGKTGGSVQLPALEAVKLRKKALNCAEKVGGMKALWRLGDKDRSQALDQEEFLMLMKMASDVEEETSITKRQSEIQSFDLKFIVGDILRAPMGEEGTDHYTGGDVGKVVKVIESEREDNSISILWTRTGATTRHLEDHWHAFIKEDPANSKSQLSVREATCLFWLLDEDESGLIEFEEFEAWLAAAAGKSKSSGHGGGGKKNKF